MAENLSDSAETSRLLHELQSGTPRAFEELFGRHRPLIRRFVELRLDNVLRSRIDASDVVQETQLEAFRRLPDFLQRQPMPFRLWVRKTAYERLLTLRRQHVTAAARSVVRELPLPDRSSVLLAGQLASPGPTPSQELALRELVQQVRVAIAQLPDVDREILLMRHYEELSYQEISQILDIQSAAARKRYGRALLRLHQLLSGAGPEASHE
jgi:RNA polymerase sigma-70 factor (ECF subfamily)